MFLGALGCWLAATAPLAAQLRPLVIHGGTVLTGDGQTIEDGTVVLRGDRIGAVGPSLKPPLLARKIPANGKYVTPGLIDAHSTLALRFAMGAKHATARAADAFDRYAEDEIRAAWREGVTTVYLPARAANGVGGFGCVVRLQRAGSPDEFVLAAEAALCAAVGADGDQGPVARVKAAAELRQQFRAAREYREAWEEYEEDVKEYEKKLAERAKKQADGEEKPAKKNHDNSRKGAAPPDEKKPNEAKGGKKDEEKKDELKKPVEPKKDRNAEVLLRVIDGEVRLRVEAHHPADILNVLEIAEEYDAALILEGASGAHLVADRLAELDVPVVLSAAPAPVAYVDDARRYVRPDAAAVLQQAGVNVYFGPGSMSSTAAAPHLALRVSRAGGHGFDADAALEALTYGAARLLGVEKEIGRVRSGLKADLVVWSDYPFAPGAKVERVFVGGKEVYRSDAEQQEEQE